MRKISNIILAAVTVLCLCSCSGSKSSDASVIFISIPQTSVASENAITSEADSSAVNQVTETNPATTETISVEVPVESLPSTSYEEITQATDVATDDTQPIVTQPSETQPSVPVATVSPVMCPIDPAAALANVDYSLAIPVPAGITTDRANSQQTMDLGGIYLKNQDQPVIYLTFTLGYETGYTQAMLDLLDAKGVKAAFFMVASTYVNEANYPLMRQMVERGHIIGNHGYAHKYTNEMSDTDLVNDIVMGAGVISQALGGYNVQYYRPPYGYVTLRNIYVSGRLGQICTNYSFLYYDYEPSAMPTHDEALAKLITGIQPGAVYYLHVTQCNYEALGDFIDYARSQGYTFLRLDQ